MAASRVLRTYFFFPRLPTLSVLLGSRGEQKRERTRARGGGEDETETETRPAWKEMTKRRRGTRTEGRGGGAIKYYLRGVVAKYDAVKYCARDVLAKSGVQPKNSTTVVPFKVFEIAPFVLR